MASTPEEAPRLIAIMQTNTKPQGSTMKLFHVTTHEAASQIMAKGFRDCPQPVGGIIVTGVWLSDAPWYDGANVDLGDLPKNRTCLTLELPEDQMAEFELVEGDAMYREWCIPAALANTVPVSHAVAAGEGGKNSR